MASNPPSDVKSVPVFSKPLVCYPDNKDVRPALVPEFTGKNCGIDESENALSQTVSFYKKVCEENRSSPSSFSLTGPFAFSQDDVTSLKEKTICADTTGVYKTAPIPVVLDMYGLLHPTHRFYEITHRLNVDQIQDFRSSEAFDEAAILLEDDFKNTGKRTLAVNYPASGSHMTPLILALEMIDHGVIDSADFVYTEIDYDVPNKIGAYLDALTKQDQLFTDLNRTEKVFDNGAGGKEVTFHFLYNGRPIKLVIALERSGKQYTRDEYVRESDLVIIHDLGEPTDHAQVVNQVYNSWNAVDKKGYLLMEASDVSGDTQSVNSSLEGSAIGTSHYISKPFGCALSFGRKMNISNGVPFWSLDHRGKLLLVDRKGRIAGSEKRISTRGDPFFSSENNYSRLDFHANQLYYGAYLIEVRNSEEIEVDQQAEDEQWGLQQFFNMVFIQ